MSAKHGPFIEIESRITEMIKFQTETFADMGSMIDGKLTMVGIPDLKAMKKIEVDKLKVESCYDKAWRVQVLLNFKPTGLYLEPNHLLTYEKIIFEYETLDDGTRVLRATGLRELSSGRITRLWRLGRVALRNRKNVTKEKKYAMKDIDKVAVDTVGPRDISPKHLMASDVGVGSSSSHNISDLHDDGDFPPIYQNTIMANKAKAVHMPLEYNEPSFFRNEKVAKIAIHDVQKEIHGWEHAIVGYLVAEDGEDHNVELYVKKRWCDWGYYDTYKLKHGFFLFNFKNDADKLKVLQQGQQFINNRPFIIKRWTPTLSLEPSLFLATVPVWVRFPCLDLQFWSLTSLGKISSIIGEPLFTDEPTAKKEMLQYARVCIEIKIGDKLPDVVGICMDNNDTILEQAVEYEWKPQPCGYSSSLLHNSSACSNNTLSSQINTFMDDEKDKKLCGKNKSVEMAGTHSRDNNCATTEAKDIGENLFNGPPEIRTLATLFSEERFNMGTESLNSVTSLDIDKDMDNVTEYDEFENEEYYSPKTCFLTIENNESVNWQFCRKMKDLGFTIIKYLLG